MNELEQKTITSMEVAEMVDKQHKNLLADIRGYLNELGRLKIEQSDFFTESTYKNSQNKEQPCYLVTKKGCEFIAHKLTGIKGTEFTARYIERFHDMEDVINEKAFDLSDLSPELQAIFAHDKRISKIDDRVTDLENNMTIDYGQQVVIGDEVNKVVINALGGKQSPAYTQFGKKVFSECNRDIKHYFHVNARNNIPKKRFDEAIRYVQNWHPCTNTQMMISQAQEEN